MDIAIIFAVALVLLFVLAFMTKRRFGVLALALAAGALLSDLWAETLTPLIQQAGVDVEVPPMILLVSIGLVILPAVLLLFSGPSYKKLVPRLIGSFLFATLAVALLVEPLGSTLVLEGRSKEVYEYLHEHRVYIVTAGLIIALGDILTTRTSKHRGAKH